MQTQKKYAIEAAILNRVLDHDWTLNRKFSVCNSAMISLQNLDSHVPNSQRRSRRVLSRLWLSFVVPQKKGVLVETLS